jgi:hypothetical protein
MRMKGNKNSTKPNCGIWIIFGWTRVHFLFCKCKEGGRGRGRGREKDIK